MGFSDHTDHTRSDSEVTSPCKLTVIPCGGSLLVACCWLFIIGDTLEFSGKMFDA